MIATTSARHSNILGSRVIHGGAVNDVIEGIYVRCLSDNHQKVLRSKCLAAKLNEIGDVGCASISG